MDGLEESCVQVYIAGSIADSAPKYDFKPSVNINKSLALLYLFTFSLFNDAFSSSCYVSSENGNIKE
jgi:hypothetical protein